MMSLLWHHWIRLACWCRCGVITNSRSAGTAVYYASFIPTCTTGTTILWIHLYGFGSKRSFQLHAVSAVMSSITLQPCTQITLHVQMAKWLQEDSFLSGCLVTCMTTISSLVCNLGNHLWWQQPILELPYLNIITHTASDVSIFQGLMY